MEWRDEYDIGHPVIDQQHRHLVTVVSAIERVSDGWGVQSVDMVLEYFDRLLRIHFETEESLLERHGYPYLHAHAAEHARLAAEVRQHVDRSRESGQIYIKQLVAFLKDYIDRHTLGADRDIGLFLRVVKT